MAHGFNGSSTWYETTAQRGAGWPVLTGEVEVDACVIGAGLAGITTALELVRRGKSVVLLEAQRLSWGASGRNGGFVSSGFAEGMDNVAARVGPEAAKALYDLSRAGTDYVRSEIAKGDPSIKMGEGWMVALRHRDNGSLKAHGETMARLYGEPVRYQTVDQTREHLRSARYFESLASDVPFHFHPLRYALMLAGTAEKLGARIHEMSPARAVERDGAGWRVSAGQGSVRAAAVVYCVSSLDRRIHGPTGRAVLPVATYVAVTEPLTQNLIATPSAISDTRRAGDYYRLIPEGRILWGGAITTRVSEPARLAERMKGIMLSVYPGLGNPRIDHSWAGLMGYALHKMPVIGTDGQGQWWATAFGGHGMNTTAMAGLVVARGIAGEDDGYRRFAPYGPRWAYGQLGRLGVQGAYWWMQARDRWDEARST